MQGRLISDDDGQKERARRMGIEDFSRKYNLQEMANQIKYLLNIYRLPVKFR